MNRGKKGIYRVVFSRLFSIVAKIITIVAFVALVLSVISKEESGRNVSWLFIFGYTSFFIYIFNVLLFLIYVIRLSRWSLLLLVGLIYGYGTFVLNYQLNVVHDYEQPVKKLKVLTYNVKGFRDENWNLSADSVLDVIARENPDVLALQECYLHGDVETYLEKHLPNLKYINRLPSEVEDILTGIVIMSRYPLRNFQKIDFGNGVNGAHYCDMVVNRDTTRIFNLHLQTTGLELTDREMFQIDLEDVNLIGDSLVNKKFIRIFDKLKKSNLVRAAQSDTLSAIIKLSPYPVIVCGDFNDVPTSYVYATIKNSIGLTDAFVERGSGYGYSFKDFYGFMRIDFVLSSERFKVESYNSPSIVWSDHNPVVVELSENN